MKELIAGLGMEIVPVTSESAYMAADAYRRWGKGMPANAIARCCMWAMISGRQMCRRRFEVNDAQAQRTDPKSAATPRCPC